MKLKNPKIVDALKVSVQSYENFIAFLGYNPIFHKEALQAKRLLCSRVIVKGQVKL
jgi:hypothetical protein